jgi:DNA (cytosine-5)-methyltransferase 1
VPSRTIDGMGRMGRWQTRTVGTAIDCFAGCGGMTAGFRQAGYRVIGAIENDPGPCRVYAENHPRVHLWPIDVQAVSVAEVRDALELRTGELDLLGGCPPCQGFSTLRTYNGSRNILDEQNDLIFEFQRLVLGLLPKHVMLENVPGLRRDQRFERFKSALESAGYNVQAKILDVFDYAVPQHRRRLVLLASSVGPVSFAQPSRQRRSVRDAIGWLPRSGESGDPLHDLPEKRTPHVKKIIAAIPVDGGSRAALPGHLVLPCHKRSDGFKDVYGRMAWNKPAPTITTGCFNPSKGRFLHPTADRGITMREAALLQSFSKSYKFPIELGKVSIATMIGNALPPKFICHHAKALAAVR